jgi:hypothetical protein
VSVLLGLLPDFVQNGSQLPCLQRLGVATPGLGISRPCGILPARFDSNNAHKCISERFRFQTSDIGNLLEHLNGKVSFNLSRRIDGEIQKALREQAPFAYRILKLSCRWRSAGRWLAKGTRFILECCHDPVKMTSNYRVLVLGRVIGRSSVSVQDLVVNEVM